MNAEAPAEISTRDALRLDAMYREWQAFKASLRGNSAGGTGAASQHLAGPLGWIIPRSGSLLPDKHFRWKYDVTVVSGPFAKLVTPAMTDLSTTTTWGFNTAENDNEETLVLGNIDVVPTSPECGDCVGVLPIHNTYTGPILAQLFWTFFESNDPTDGYWAWWFTLPNQATYHHD